jgi:methionyl-tRNA formyltransferase
MGNFIVYATGLKGLSFLKNLSHIPQYVLTYDNGELEQYEKILNFCNLKNIKVYDKKNEPKKYDFDHIFVIGWQFILEKNIKKLIVFHDSYIPKMRGFSPTVNSLISGNRQLGVTAFSPTGDLTKGPDYGLIYDRKYIDIEYPIKLSDAFSLIGIEYAKIANNILNKSIKPYNIDYSESSYTMWLNDKDMRIDWKLSASEVLNKINALSYPYTGAKALYHDKILSIHSAHICENSYNIENRKQHVGKIFKIIDGNPYVICGSGIIVLDSVLNDKNKEIKFSKIRRKFE